MKTTNGHDVEEVIQEENESDVEQLRLQSLEEQVSALRTEIKEMRTWINAISNTLNRIVPSSRNTSRNLMP